MRLNQILIATLLLVWLGLGSGSAQAGDPLTDRSVEELREKARTATTSVVALAYLYRAEELEAVSAEGARSALLSETLLLEHYERMLTISASEVAAKYWDDLITAWHRAREKAGK